MAPPFRLRATRQAQGEIDALRGTAKKRYAALMPALRSQGCRAAGYRLLATEGARYSMYCCVHLTDAWRLVLTFEPDAVVVVAVGRHIDEQFYASLEPLGVSPIGQRRDQKPHCCADDGWPAVGPSRSDLEEMGPTLVADPTLAVRARITGALGTRQRSGLGAVRGVW